MKRLQLLWRFPRIERDEWEGETHLVLPYVEWGWHPFTNSMRTFLRGDFWLGWVGVRVWREDPPPKDAPLVPPRA